MKSLISLGFAAALVLPFASSQTAGQGEAITPHRNVIIVVADGLRYSSVNERDTPALWAARADGVDFQNSHAVFPTLTMANASAIATGQSLGNSGSFSNTISVGYATFDTGNFNLPAGTPVPFIENDQVLADLDSHYKDNYLGADTLLALARAHGYNTAVIGKHGPVGVQDVAALAPTAGGYSPTMQAIIVDDVTGTSAGPPLPAPLVQQMQKAKLSLEAPSRTNGYGTASPYSNGYSGDNARPGTIAANLVQQQWFADVTTQAILPMFEHESKPFMLVYWSRDPDGTQHNQGDSLGTLYPGINGPTSRQAVQNADRNLHQIIAWLDERPSIKANTDIVITADHGFATISRREIDRNGRRTTSKAAQHFYLDSSGRVETEQGTLPHGFLAIDLALDLKLNLFDPDRRVPESSRSPYRRLRLGLESWEHPANGNGLIGADVQRLDGSDATAIVASNGGSDLVYVPSGNEDVVRSIVGHLLTYDYVGGIFVDDRFGPIPGSLPFSAIGLAGTTPLPRPAIVVAFKVFYFNPEDLRTAVQIADTSLQQGQGTHGGFGRDSTLYNMIAVGPDFKRGFRNAAPVGNNDIVPTLVKILGFDLPEHHALAGRVIEEALSGGPEAPVVPVKTLESVAANGRQTTLFYQELAGARYLRAACFPTKEGEDDIACR